MKGQVTVEYLVISVIALSLLTISVFALLNIKDYSEKTSNLFKFRSSVLSLSNTMSEICALGSGNSRSLVLTVPISVESEESIVRFTGSGSSIVRPSNCDVEPAELDGFVYVKNDNGIITITKQ